MYRIHIIEDDDSVRDALKEFSGSQVQVLCHSDAESFFGKEPPSEQDIVLVDINLPGIHGEAVLKWLKALKKIPKIVVISGLPYNELQKKLSGLDISTIIRKPLNIPMLQSALGLF